MSKQKTNYFSSQHKRQRAGGHSILLSLSLTHTHTFRLLSIKGNSYRERGWGGGGLVASRAGVKKVCIFITARTGARRT